MKKEEIETLLSELATTLQNHTTTNDINDRTLQLAIIAFREAIPGIAQFIEAKLERDNMVNGMFVNVPGKWLKEEAYWLPELRQFVDETKTYRIDYSDLHAWLMTCRNTREELQKLRERKFSST